MSRYYRDNVILSTEKYLLTKSKKTARVLGMATITLKYRDSKAREISYFLKRKFGGKARVDSKTFLERAIKLLIAEAVHNEAKKMLVETQAKTGQL